MRMDIQMAKSFTQFHYRNTYGQAKKKEEEKLHENETSPLHIHWTIEQGISEENKSQ